MRRVAGKQKKEKLKTKEKGSLPDYVKVMNTECFLFSYSFF